MEEESRLDGSAQVAKGEPPLRARMREVAGVFLRLGFTAFGGPAVHAALIEDEVVGRRKWIDRQHFLDLLAAVNFIPGPNSTELVIHLGLLRAGWVGLIVAGVCFIVPAMLIILPLGWLYATYGRLPDVAGPLVGIRACVVAIVAAALWRFGRAGVKDRFTAAVGGLATVAGFAMQTAWFRVPQAELIILALAALAGAVWYRSKGEAAGGSGISGPSGSMPLAIGVGVSGVAGMGTVGGNLLTLALFFLKVGATLFGSGYVLVSYLQVGLVARHGWLNARELMDAVAVGQVTPGPLLTTATFIGYVLGERWGGPGMALAGAVVATGAIFLPAFVFVALLSPLWPRLRGSRWARGALDGMNAAVVALILVVTVGLGREAITGMFTGLVAAGTLLGLVRWRVNSTWLIVAAGVLGWLVG